jgi:Uncharacterised ACR, YggU family COG1872
LKIALKAPAVEGRAKRALVASLVDTFSIDKTAIALLSGGLSPRKILLLRGVCLASANAIEACVDRSKVSGQDAESISSRVAPDLTTGTGQIR